MSTAGPEARSDAVTAARWAALPLLGRRLTQAASHSFWRGVRDETPILLGVAPFGMIYGVLALQVGLDPWQAQAMSAIVFAGSAQFITAQLLQVQTPLPVIVVTAVIVNLRHLLYSATLAPYLRRLSGRWKSLLAYLLTDEAFAVSVLNYQRGRDVAVGHWYFLGAGVTLWTAWQLSTAAGVFLGAKVPDAWGLEFTLPLTFIALVVPTLRDRAAVATAIAAGILAVALAGLPYKLDLIVATLLAIGVGMWMEERR